MPKSMDSIERFFLAWNHKQKKKNIYMINKKPLNTFTRLGIIHMEKLKLKLVYEKIQRLEKQEFNKIIWENMNE